MKNRVHVASLLSNILDNQFKLFGLRFGVSAIIDLIPGLGDILDVLLSSYIVWVAIRMHIPKTKIAQMVWNIFFSFLIGLIPVIGDAAYIFYKPNSRNLAILKRYENTIIEGTLVK
jgi:Domain of unknown function (DUF4112)